MIVEDEELKELIENIFWKMKSYYTPEQEPKKIEENVKASNEIELLKR